MRFKLILLILGGALIYFAFQEFKLSSATESTPQQITCSDLGQFGPGSNAYVEMTEFLLCDFSFVYEEQVGQWSKIWVPAVPVNGEYHQKIMQLVESTSDTITTDMFPMPTDIKVIVKSEKIKNEAQLSQVSNQDTIRGVVVNKIEKLGSEERNILSSSYPGVDFRSVWILQERRQPAGIGKMFGLGAGGLGLMAFAGFLFFRSRNEE